MLLLLLLFHRGTDARINKHWTRVRIGIDFNRFLLLWAGVRCLTAHHRIPFIANRLTTIERIVFNWIESRPCAVVCTAMTMATKRIQTMLYRLCEGRRRKTEKLHFWIARDGVMVSGGGCGVCVCVITRVEYIVWMTTESKRCRHSTRNYNLWSRASQPVNVLRWQSHTMGLGAYVVWHDANGLCPVRDIYSQLGHNSRA